MREKARALGFDVCRITSAEPPAHARERLAAWLAEGAQGDMAWMAETFERRADPRKLMADARSLVMLGLNYGPAGDPLAALRRPARARSQSTRATATITMCSRAS